METEKLDSNLNHIIFCYIFQQIDDMEIFKKIQINTYIMKVHVILAKIIRKPFQVYIKQI